MKRHLSRTLVVIASLVLLLFTVPQPGAMAHHGKGHHPGGHCLTNPHPHNFKAETEDMTKQEKKQYKRQHRHHKHQCNKYPPGQARPNTTGQSATFPAESSDQGGITVGAATLVAIVGVGTLLIARRRWAFRPNGR